MSWKPCPSCGTDGYRLMPYGFGFAAICPKCDRILAQGSSPTDAAYAYTRAFRAVKP